MNAKKLARFMHDEYEKEAHACGWNTQESCRVPFGELPEANRQVMIKVAKHILLELGAVPDKLATDIKVLKEIATELQDNYADDTWDLSEGEKDYLYRITDFNPEYDWDDCNLGHFIDGMQRALTLQRRYWNL